MAYPYHKRAISSSSSENFADDYYNSHFAKSSSPQNSLRNRIISLGETGERLVKKGSISEGLGCYTTMFGLLKTIDESPESEFNNVFCQTMDDLNKIAMKFVSHGDTESAHQILLFCEDATNPEKHGNFPLQRNKTFNNLACLYRRVGKPKGALNYLRSALAILSKNNFMHHSATTYLNLSAVQSQLGDHASAFQNAKNALLHAQDDLRLHNDETVEGQDRFKEKVITLAIAYHNLGAEEEHMRNFSKSLEWYEKAFSVMDDYGIVDEKLYKKFKNVWLAAQDKSMIMTLNSAKRNYSPQSGREASPLGATMSATRTSSNGFTKHSKSQTRLNKSPVFDLHHRKSPGNQTFIYKDKKIVSRKKQTTKPKPIVVYSGPSGGYPIGWSQPMSTKEGGDFYRPQQYQEPKYLSRDINSRDESDFSDNEANYYKQKKQPVGTPLKNQDKDVGVYDLERSPQNEIQALEEMGILEWPDEDIPSGKKSKEKETIKRNQEDFFRNLKEAGVKNLNGNLELLDSSASSGSSSPRNNPSSSKGKSKKDIRSQQVLEQQQLSDDKRKKNGSEKSEEIQEEMIRSTVSSKNSFRSKLGNSVVKNVAPSDPQFEMRSGPQSQEIQPTHQSYPYKKYTREQVKALIEERNQAATTIQRTFKGKLARDYYELLKDQKERLGEFFLIKKRFMIMTPFETIDKQTVAKDPSNYFLCIYAQPSAKLLYFNLFDCEDGKKYDTKVSYSEIDTKKKKIHNSYNIRALSEMSKSIIKRLYIVDHLLLLHDERDVQYMSSERDNSDNPEESVNDALDGVKTGEFVNYKEYEKEIMLIQKNIRGKLAREKKDLAMERKWNFLLVKSLRVDDHLVTVRLVQRTSDGVTYATGTNLFTKKKFNMLELPPDFVNALNGNYEKIFDLLHFDADACLVEFMPAVEARLFPESKNLQTVSYDEKKIIKIQSNYRRHLAQQNYKIQLEKKRENPNNLLLRRYAIPKNGFLFKMRIFHVKDQKAFQVTARCEDYLADVQPLKILTSDVDKHGFNQTVSNLKRLADIISPHISLEVTKHEAYVLVFDKKEFERSGRRLEAQVQSYTDLGIFGAATDAGNAPETQKKIWAYLQDKNFVESNKHILKNLAGLQTIKDTVKIMEDSDPMLKDLGKTENDAAKKIQKCYRKVLMNRYFANNMGRDRVGYRDSVSLILANSVRGKSYSMFTETYQRMIVTEEELRRESTNDYIFIKTIPNIQFRNTPLEARAHVFHNKNDPKEKSIDVEVIIPIIGLHEVIVIPESKISQNVKKSTTFLKKIDEQLINRLEYDPVAKRVVFVEGGKDDAEVPEPVERTINPYIQAKLTRLKYLRRKARTKDMMLISIETREIDKVFVNMSFYWFVLKRQMRILVEHIDQLTYYKEIVIKFDGLQNVSEIRGLVNEMNIIPAEFIPRIKPVAEFIGSSIVLQQDTKSTDKRDFRVLMDGTVFSLEFANSKFILASLKDLSQESLNKMGGKQTPTDIRALMRLNRLIDVNQFEKVFKNKLNLMGLLNPEQYLEQKRDSDAFEDLAELQNQMENHHEKVDQPKQYTKEELEKAAMVIQRMFKRHMVLEKFGLLRLRKLMEARIVEGYGRRIKKTSKKVDDTYWIICVHRKELENHMTNYYFTASSVRDASTKKKRFAKGTYRADNMLLINSEGKGLVDFLLDRLEIHGQNIEFPLNFDSQNNFMRIDAPPNQASDERTPDSEERKGDPFAPEAKLEDGDQVVFENGLDSHRRSKDSNPLSVKPPLSHRKEVKIEERDSKDDLLLQQKAEALVNTLLLYNVYYNKDENAEAVINPLLANPEKISEDVKRQLREGSLKPTSSNFIKISVDMDELRKYTPNLSVNSSQELKHIAAELANSIQISDKGEVMVNYTKLNPNALNVVEKKLAMIPVGDPKASRDSKNDSKKKVLFKMTKVYNEKKYLILINYIEKLSSINGVLTITGREDDQVYEDFELYLEVNAVCLSHSSIKPLSWELPLQEGQRLSGMTSTTKIAKFFANNIHVFGDQLLLSTPFNIFIHQKNVIVMNENAIKMIQNKFRARKFSRNFSKFKATLAALKQKIITRAVINLNTVSYHVFGFEKNELELEVQVWDLMNYEKYDVMVWKSAVETLYLRDQKAAMKAIFKFLSFEFNSKKEYVLKLKERNMLDYLGRNGEN